MMTERMGMRGRYFDSWRAVVPDSVNTTSMDASTFMAARTADDASASACVIVPPASVTSITLRKCSSYGNTFSASLQMDSTVRTDRAAWSPRSVSAPNKIPSAPSSTMLATSVASARVGRGLEVMLSITRVMITGLPARLHFCRTIFWMRAIFSTGTSRPRHARERMTASACSRMESKLRSAVTRSTLAATCVSDLCSASNDFNSWTHLPSLQ
mmetsp:Transcript_25267/g.47780  ORF Transcript_25267/g.47780 Transcript_25267/m.47780 type:complete len:213 (-) Transcript_25267:932-1570(-)